MEKIFVKDLNEKDNINSIFLIQEKMILKDKNGKTYISLTIADSSGKIDGKIWERADQLNDLFYVGDFVRVKGHIQLYQNRKQFVVHEIEKYPISEINLNDYISASERNPNDMFEDLIQMIDTVKNKHIHQLLFDSITDEEIKQKLLLSPAAKTIHHAYVGGLLEHILSICHILTSISDHYKFLNRDYLIFGAIFHDIGKVFELEVSNGINYSNVGRLVGHMGIACQMIDTKSSKILGFPNSLKDELKHIVLSHHGKIEYGSAKRPKFLEAMVVAMIDDLDSKINTMTQFFKDEMSQPESWTKYNQHFDRYLYLDIYRKTLESLKDSEE